LLALGSLLAEQTREGAAISTHVTDVLTRSEQMIETISATNRTLNTYMKSHRPADLAPLYVARLTIVDQARGLGRAVRSDPALAAAAAAFATYTLRGMDVMTTYANDLRQGNTAATNRINASPATRKLSVDLEHSKVVLDQLAEQQSRATLSARRVSARQTEALLLIIALAGIVLTALVTLLFGMRIVVRLRRLGDNARRLADGSPTVPDEGNDEIGELDRIYRVMADRIQDSSRQHDEVLAELRAERNVAGVLQQALLPQIAPIPGLRIDTAYATPAEGAQIGGDWFDVFALSDRLVGLSVGDVTGHGLRAAATMGFVRQAIRIVARLDTDPAAVMGRVNHVVCEESGSIVTAFFGVFDRESGRLRYALAGHGPPIVASADGAIALLEGEGMLLGLDDGTRFSAYEVRLAPGDGLVLYTDGIVEAERDYLKGMRDLEIAVRNEFRDPAANMADGIQRRIFNEAAPRDDSALLVLKILELASLPTHPQRTWSFDARDQGTAWRVKRELLAALAALGPSAPDPAVAEMVFGELLSNVVRHTPGAARVSFAVDDGHVVLSVADRGRPFPAGGGLNDGAPTPDGEAESGRGLFLVGALCRRIAIEPTADGKCLSAVLPVAEPERRDEGALSAPVGG
jgi:serine phosphatase RsbU (regulator of sigma subunit)/anti-sigma regulatory factor (Ser/Thr protein kinase)